MKQLIPAFLLFMCLHTQAQQLSGRNQVRIKIDTTDIDLKKISDSITGGTAAGDFERARMMLYWLSSNFDWLSTDYKSRTVNEIIARGGGNCFELAKVYIAMIKAAGIQYRNVCEINVHPITPRRQASAAELVKGKGNTYSVFGLQHNDHRWVEIYHAQRKRWEPADPATGVIGLDDWLKARVWFGERKTIDTSISNEMIVPFAIFVAGDDKLPVENRSVYYLIDQFNELYQGQLSTLPEWADWTNAVKNLTDPSRNAFLGKENLHQHQEQIRRLADIYQALKKSYQARHS